MYDFKEVCGFSVYSYKPNDRNNEDHKMEYFFSTDEMLDYVTEEVCKNKVVSIVPGTFSRLIKVENE